MFDLGFPKDWSTIRKLIFLKRAGIAGGGGDPLITLNGSLVRFTSKASKPVKQIVGAIEPVQSGSGDPSPDNVRPITGWTGANVTRTGKNLTTFFSDGKVPSVSNGQLVNASGYRSDYVKCKPNTHYTLTATGASTVYLFYYDANHNFLGFDSAPSYTKTGTSSANAYYLMCRIQIDTIGDAQLEEGTGTAIEPYTGNTLTLSFGSTVYGGNYTINEDGTVSLTVDRASIDLDELTYTYRTESGLDYYYFQSSAISNFLIGPNDLICSQYKNAKGGNRKTMTSDHMIAVTNTTNSNRVCIRDDSYSDPDVFKTAMSGVQLVYEISPVTTTLSSVTMLQTLVGENNMWQDTGDITVKAYGVEIVEPQLNSLQSLNLLLGNGYVNNHTQDDVSDDEALDIILGR